MLCCLSNVNRCLQRRVEGRNHYISSRFLLPKYTYNMCLLFSRSCFVEEYREKSRHSESVSHWPYPYMHPGFPSALSSFSSRPAGSLHSSLHENYSMGKFKECGVHSVEQLAEHPIHSLATQRVQGAQEKWKACRD